MQQGFVYREKDLSIRELHLDTAVRKFGENMWIGRAALYCFDLDGPLRHRFEIVGFDAPNIECAMH
jgi:hypothetical protein